MTMRAPQPDEYVAYYARYIALVPPGDLIGVMRAQLDELKALLAHVTPTQAEFSYAPGKWSLKEVVGHCADTERVFGFRALHISRGDPSPLPSFDQDTWAPEGRFNALPFAQVLDQWVTARRANLSALEGTPSEVQERRGTVSGNPATVRALYHILPGHVAYHITLIKRDYLKQ
ncbi:MAG: DinB family protein [Gemmatimonadaceae bacterium]